MSHRRTFSARFPDMRNVSLDSPPLTPIPNIADLPMVSSRKPRAYWLRTTFLALFVLISVSVYVLLVSPPALRPISFLDLDRTRSEDAARPSRWTPEAIRLAALKHRRPHATVASSNPHEQIYLNQTQELAAISNFIASLPQNVLPSTIDPSQPIDPQLVLDFDTRGPRAEEELQHVVRDVWARNPVMLYSKVHSSISREIKQILSGMYLLPAPVIVDVDERPDESVLVPLLYRLTSMNELPILLVGGRTVGTPKEIRYLAHKGELQRLITQAGGVIDGARKKKAKKL
ncbi:hypothetical protein BN946_scf184281.g15 [Trametes cinnabarina]|uniref:Uncharacterized protein n=1 Tax=Pycnoporus cinnabarinus TaxID=5643 RepID=A0A060SWT3_PYCCI|nr:hypothetical protein BN946_scf184281.g15 [Trametes cinnabarina]